MNVTIADIDGPLDFGNDVACDFLGLGSIGDSDQYDNKLITARAVDQIPAPDIALQYPEYVAPDPVATLLTEVTAYLLETIEIDLQQRQPGS